jgi:cyclopropane-fatty-acyl-phospholipid synthase
MTRAHLALTRDAALGASTTALAAAATTDAKAVQAGKAAAAPALAAERASFRRRELARGIVHQLRRALPEDAGLDIHLLDAPAPDRDALSGAATSQARSSGRASVTIAGPDALARMLWPPSADALGEAYLCGDVDIAGDVWAAVDAGRAFDLRRLGWRLPRLAAMALELRRGTPPAPPLSRVATLSGRRHSQARDLAAVRFHYDAGNEFFALWLDRRLTYSCAYFDTPDTTIDDAQEAKLDLICRKLGLRPDMRLLDIGCGWGSLVVYAAQRYGVYVTGVTLSQKQADWANFEIARLGLADRAWVEVRDYPDLAGLGLFDAAASVGMFEHVGRERMDAYFGAALRAVKPGGLFLNHGISTTAVGGRLRRAWGRFGDGGFVGRYVFPDGELLTVEDAVGFARRAGFELLNTQSLRPHYALTLRVWVERLESQADRARQLAGEEVYRTWRIYMAAARRGFEDGSLDVAQLLLARPGTGSPARLPLRPWW